MHSWILATKDYEDAQPQNHLDKQFRVVVDDCCCGKQGATGVFVWIMMFDG